MLLLGRGLCAVRLQSVRSLVAIDEQVPRSFSYLHRRSELCSPRLPVPRCAPTLLGRRWLASTPPDQQTTEGAPAGSDDGKPKTVREFMPWFLRWMVSDESEDIATASKIFQVVEIQGSSPDFLVALGAGYLDPFVRAAEERKEQTDDSAASADDAEESPEVLHLARNGLVPLQPGDTFHQWFGRTMLHVWLVLVRLRFCTDQKKGQAISQEVFNCFWQAMELRMNHDLIGTPGRAFVLGKQLKAYVQFYYGSVCAYDEALYAGSDSLLAEAVWRNIYQMDTSSTTIEHLYSVVHYIRGQLKWLETTHQDPTTSLLRFSSMRDMPALKTSPSQAPSAAKSSNEQQHQKNHTAQKNHQQKKHQQKKKRQ